MLRTGRNPAPAPARLRRRSLVALGAAFAALALAATASAQVPRSFWGIVPINDLSESEFDTLGAANTGTLRVLTLWQRLEPSPDGYDFSSLDRTVAGAAENGIEVLPFVFGTPRWSGAACDGLDDRACATVPPLSGAPRAAWTDFLATLVGRYGTQGTFWSDGSDAYDPPYVPITDWQVWNEPSSTSYYRKPKPKGYAKLLKISHDAITGVDPAAKIVLAGVFPSPEGGKKVLFTNYLAGLFDVKRIGRYFDIAALHPYAATVGRLRNQIKTYRKLLKGGGLASKQLWITEVGWGSDPPIASRPLIKGPDGQRDLLEGSFSLLAAQASAWKLAGVIWYAFRDPGIGYEDCPFCSSAGLLEEGGEPKPAWYSYLKFTGGSDAPSPPAAPEPEPPTCPTPFVPC